MSTNRVIRTTVESPTDTNISPTTVTQSGSGNSWTLATKRINLTNSANNSTTLRFGFTQDFRSADPTYGIPADRCIVTYKARPKIDLNIISGGLGIVWNINYTSNLGNQNFPYFNDTNYGLTDIVQTGSAVTTVTGDQQPITADNFYVAVQIDTGNSNSNGLHDVILQASADILANTGPAGSLTRRWEADNIIIDGLGGDSISMDTVTSELACLGGLVRDGQSQASSTTAIDSEEKVIKFASADLTARHTSTATAKNILSLPINLSPQFELLASTNNLVLAEAILTAATTVSLITTFKPGVDDNFTSAVTAAFQGNLIFDVNSEYTWDSFNLNSYFVQGFAVDDFSQSQGEYNWTFLSTDSWDDWTTITWIGDESTWDNWPKDVWEEPYGLGTAGSMIISPAFKLGDVVTYNSAFTLAEDTALEEAAEAILASQFTTDFTAVGIIDVTVAISSAMSPSLTANIIYDLNDSSITITGAFSPVLTANAITDTFADIDVAFTFAVEPTFKPAGFSTITTASTFEQLVPTFKPGGIAALVASAGTLTVGRLFFPADPYQIAHVSRELRKVVLPIENRQTLVMSENRLNTITQETSDYLVPQETRSLKLRIAPFKNRFSTPRVRQEQ